MKKIIALILLTALIFSLNAFAVNECKQPTNCTGLTVTGYCSQPLEKLCLEEKKGKFTLTKIIPLKYNFNENESFQVIIGGEYPAGNYTWALFARGNGKIRILASQINHHFTENESFYTQRIPISELKGLGKNPRIYAGYLLQDVSYTDSGKEITGNIWVKSNIKRIEIAAASEETTLSEEEAKEPQDLDAVREKTKEVLLESGRELPEGKTFISLIYRQCNDEKEFIPGKDKKCILSLTPKENGKAFIGIGRKLGNLQFKGTTKDIIKNQKIELLLDLKELRDSLNESKLKECIKGTTYSGAVFSKNEKIKGTEFELNLKCLPVIVLDAGHGGYDPGATVYTEKFNGIDSDFQTRFQGKIVVEEKLVNLKVAKALKKALEEKGFQVIMTRETDEHLDLKERAEIANKSNASFFVSIHANTIVNSNECDAVSGPRAFIKCNECTNPIKGKGDSIPSCEQSYCNDYDQESYKFALSLDKTLLDAYLMTNRKPIVKMFYSPENDYLLAYLKPDIKAVFLEIGYLCNEKDLKTIGVNIDEIVEKLSSTTEDYALRRA